VRKIPHSLFWFTIASLAIASGIAFYFAEQQLPSQIELNVTGQPTLGNKNAEVHVVLFEEPKCPHCARFTEKVFPKLKGHFIDTDKITFTIVPVSFIKGSMPAAQALLCAYKQDSNRPNDKLFFTFLDYMYKNQGDENSDWANPDNLQKMAKEADPAINIAKLKRCFDDESLRAQIEKNTQYGSHLMGHLITPTIYVNGMKADDVSYETVSKLIDASLKPHHLTYSILKGINNEKL
jgi:protein-disulfide isomerase